MASGKMVIGGRGKRVLELGVGLVAMGRAELSPPGTIPFLLAPLPLGISPLP